MSTTITPLQFDENLMANVADMRARGCSWEATASEVGWEVADLRRAIRRAPEYARIYEAAKNEVREEAEAEMLVVFRSRLRDDDDPADALRAAQHLEKYLAGQRRDQTRIEVEKLRAETARMKIAAKQAEPNEGLPDMTTLTPEEIHNPKAEARWASYAVDWDATVYLWSGEHPIGGVAPDDTDVPLVIFKDDTVRGRTLFWVARVPFQSDITKGPFPPRHRAAPVAELRPEAMQQMEEFVNAQQPRAAG